MINELELLVVVWEQKHLRLYIHCKLIKLLTDHRTLQPLIKSNCSHKMYCVRLKNSWGRLAHFTIDVNHIAGKHLALTDNLSKNPSAPPQTGKTSYRTTSSFLNMVALATTLTNQKTDRTKANAKQTTNYGQRTRVNKPPLIASTTYLKHVQIQNRTPQKASDLHWMPEQLKISQR